jgi:hypothetical protein
MQLLTIWEYEAWVELAKLFFFKQYMGAKRYETIFKEQNSFGSLWGKRLT